MATDKEVQTAKDRLAAKEAKLAAAKRGDAEARRAAENDLTIAAIEAREARIDAELAQVAPPTPAPAAPAAAPADKAKE